VLTEVMDKVQESEQVAELDLLLETLISVELKSSQLFEAAMKVVNGITKVMSDEEM
jgi:hypothetical protein